MNLQRKGTEQNINFWFGSAIHFAMEDYFGYNRFGELSRAFQAYYAAFPEGDRPPGADEHYYLGLGMIDYFNQWYAKHNRDYGFRTVWLDEDNKLVAPGTEGARPLVEESFLLDLGMKVWVNAISEEMVHLKPDQKTFEDEEGIYYVEDPEDWVPGQEPIKVYIVEVPICYHGTLDRVVVDRLGRWWIMDWKTAKSADTNKLDTDDQISAYMWAAEQWLGHPIHGFVYVQLTKEIPKPPKRLSTGKLSVDKKQRTTYSLLRQELINEYGEVNKAPGPMISFLNHLASLETPEGDRFIRWDLVTRTAEQKISTYHHILAETRQMISPDLYLYPNPTRDCIWDCDFRDACLMQERGQEKEASEWLELLFEPRPRDEDGNIEPWRLNVPWPETSGNAVDDMVAQLELEASMTLNVLLPEKYMAEEEV